MGDWNTRDLGSKSAIGQDAFGDAEDLYGVGSSMNNLSEALFLQEACYYAFNSATGDYQVIPPVGCLPPSCLLISGERKEYVP